MTTVIRTRSATPLDPVAIEATTGGWQVWLRRDITQIDTDEGPAWEAGEITYTTTDRPDTDTLDVDTAWALHLPPPEPTTTEVLAIVDELADVVLSMIGGD